MSAARRVPFALAMVCCLLLPVVAHAQTGTIAGTVVEDGTLTPLNTTDGGFAVGAFGADGRGVAVSVTDSLGRYRILNLAPGSYYLKTTRATGHILELHDNIPCIATDCTVTAGTPVVVTAGATTTVDFSLAIEGKITGTVRRAADNSPIPDLSIRVYNANTTFLLPFGAVSDDNGQYTVTGLATGSYFLRLVHDSPQDFITELYGGVPCPTLAPESDCRIASGTPVDVTAGSVTSGIDFSLAKGARLSGTVRADGTETPIASLSVFALAGDVIMGGALTDASGHYTITSLPPGRYRVRTDTRPDNLNTAQGPNDLYVNEWQNGICVGCPGTPATILVQGEETIQGIDFSLAVGGSISGTVFCNTQSQDFQRPGIAAYSSTGEFVRNAFKAASLTACSSTSAVPYTITGLPTGTYFLWARATPLVGDFDEALNGGIFIDQLYGGTPCNTADCDVRKGSPVSVTAGATTSAINFVLQPGGSIPTSEDSAEYKVFDARGVEVINAILQSPGTRPYIMGLPPGTYYVTRNGLLNGGIACADCPPTAGIPIVIAPNSDGASPTFVAPPRKITGTITNASGGAPLGTITVQLVSQSGNVVASALSDMFGHYALKDLAAGTYFARTVNDRGFVDEVYADAACGTCDPHVGAPIVVPSATDVTGIDFVLAPGGIVSGLVSDTNGVVLGNVPVSLFAGTTTVAGVQKTSASGHYRLTLPTGTYRALAEATTNKGSEVYSEMPCTSAGCDPATGTPIALTTGTITSGIDFTLTSCNALTLSPPLLATGVSGRTYRQVLSAVGGTGPYRFDVTDGFLPPGVTLNATTGVLSGTPTVAGRSTFRVSVLDSAGCAADRSFVLDVQGCAFTLSPATATIAAAGGTVTITIADACGSQAVVGALSWIAEQSNTPGQVTLAVAANTHSAPRTGAVAIGRRVFEIRQAGPASQAPYGVLELPQDNAPVSGAVAVGGWALDDLEVTRVGIYRDAVNGEPAGPIFIGNAVFIPGARPDVQLAAPGVPRNDRAGFGFVVLTNTLPNQGNGTFRLHAIAEDGEGHTTLLGSRNIISNNATAQAPFGTIDTPLQGETIAGSTYVNFGWALTPQPAVIPTDGSTIQVIIDGAPIGAANYNFFRPDVSNAFPGLANSGGPVGHRTFDTTALAEGMHTISWLVTDSRPATSGLGSRYFYVANSADAQPGGSSSVTTDTEVETTDVATPLAAAPTPDIGVRAESLAVTADATNASSASDVLIQRGDEPKRRLRVSDEGTGVLTLAPMERIELTLGARDDACPATWAGYLLKDGVLSDLPVGASLDPAGTFYWQTGPGFAGNFSLLFVRTNCRGEKQQVPIVVMMPLR